MADVFHVERSPEEEARWAEWRVSYEKSRARSKRAAAIRRPPRPPHERDPGCSMCGIFPLPGRRRSWCSDECVDLWSVASDSGSAGKHLTDILGHECWRCGLRAEPGTVERWHLLGDVIEPWRGAPYCNRPHLGPPVPIPARLYVDHVKPLWLLTPDEATDLRWWLPFNLQMLCHECHGRKTKAEARLRAAIRREDPARLR